MTVTILTSTALDGTMKKTDGTEEVASKNRIAYLNAHAINPATTTYYTLSYGGTNYHRYKTLGEADKGDGITRPATIDADAVIVTEPGHATLLPLADCIGAVLYDETLPLLMLSHLGRHNLEQHGGKASVDYLVEKYGATPRKLQVWLSPAAGKEHYPLFAFNNRSLHEVAVEQLIAAGVPMQNITVSPIDTTTDTAYFSHSEFLQGNRQTDGRFCVVAMLN